MTQHLQRSLPQYLIDFNNTDEAYPQEATIHGLIEAQVVRTPQRPAFLTIQDRAISFETYNQRANRLAHYLIQEGLQVGDIVALHIPRSPSLYICALAILKARGVYVVLNPKLPRKRKRILIKDSQPRILLTPDGLAKQLPNTSATLIHLNQVFWKQLGKLPATNPDLLIQPDAVCNIVYTSGSTGEPKGVLRSHQAEINRLSWAFKQFPFRDKDVYPTFSSITAVGFVRELLTSSAGVPLLVLPEQILLSPRQLIRYLERYGATHLYLSPALLWIILAVEAEPGKRLPTARYCFLAGDKFSPDLLQKFRATLPHVKLANQYGTSEYPAATYFPVPNDLVITEGHPIPAGKPLANTHIYILNEQLEPVAPEEVGEMYLAGDTMATGYFNDPELTQQQFIDNPLDTRYPRLYRSGDLGKVGEDGQLRVIGRNDHQVNIRGFRVNLTEIEGVLRQHPAVEQAVVVSKKRSRNDTRYLVAYIVLHEPTPAIRLKNFLEKRLPDYMVPVNYRQLDTLPLLPNLKVDRVLLTNADAGNVLDFASQESLTNDKVTLYLLGIWRELFANKRITVDDGFLDLGGDSLVAVEMLLMIESALGVELPMRVLADNPTIRDLAKKIWSRDSIPISTSPLMQIRQGDDKKPTLILIPPAGATALAVGVLLRALPADHTVYGIHPLGFADDEEPQRSVVEMAQYYLPELYTIQHSDIILVGQCFGGIVAMELARQFEQERGIRLPIVMVDMHPPSSGPTWTARWMNNPQQAYNYEYHVALELERTSINNSERRQHRTWLPHRFALRTYTGKPYAGPALMIQSVHFAEQFAERARAAGKGGDPFWQWKELFPDHAQMEILPVQHTDMIGTEDQRKRIRTIISDFISRHRSV